MLLADMPQHKSSFGIYKRLDGEEFTITATLFEAPADYNYWLAYFEVAHAAWGNIHYQLHIPKRIAPSVALANALVGAAPLAQVKSFLNQVTMAGKIPVYCQSIDGWLLA